MTKKTPKTKNSLTTSSPDLATIDQLCEKYLSKTDSTVNAKDQSLLNSIRKLVPEKKKTRNLWRILGWIALVEAVIYAASYSLPPLLIPGLFRLALIQVLPYWDWTTLKEPPCIWKKPDLPQSDTNLTNGTTPEDCIICEDLTKIIERPGGALTPSQVGEDFLVEQLPLIIRRAFSVAPGDRKLHLRNVLDLHLEDESFLPCKFRTNLRTKSAFQFPSFLRKVQRKDLQIPWFAFWEFCEHHHVKECRSVIPRPPELPAMLEIADSFWFLAASNYTAVKFKYIELSFGVLWFTQMAGTSKIRLEPKSFCESACQTLEAELLPGDALLMTADLFEFSWMPGQEGEVLALAAGAQ